MHFKTIIHRCAVNGNRNRNGNRNENGNFIQSNDVVMLNQSLHYELFAYLSCVNECVNFILLIEHLKKKFVRSLHNRNQRKNKTPPIIFLR